MPTSVLITLAVWILLVLGLFYFLPPGRAAIACFMIGWLFLPVITIKIPHLPDYSKLTVTCLGVLLGIVVFDRRALLSFRPHWIDLPMLIWCAAPFAAALDNGLGAYDGLSAAYEQAVGWGVPYCIGRVYLKDLAGLRDLAIGVLAGGAVYVPLCLFEIVQGPRLHRLVYGFYQNSLDTAMRFGGWRPVVFMDQGLMVGLWMTAATLAGFWLWKTGSLTHLLGVPLVWLWPLLAGTTILVKSANAWLLLGLGLGILTFGLYFKSALPVLTLMILIPVYLALRATGAWSGGEAVAIVQSSSLGERTQSLSFRFENEDLLATRVRQQPIYGWGRWGRSLVSEVPGGWVPVPDSLWIVAFGESGAVGLAALTAVLLLPVIAFLKSYPVRDWVEPAVAPAAVVAVILLMYALDNLANAMVNPIYMLVGGGLIGQFVIVFHAPNPGWEPLLAAESAFESTLRPGRLLPDPDAKSIKV